MHTDEKMLELDRNFPLKSILQQKKKPLVTDTASLPDTKQKLGFSSSVSLAWEDMVVIDNETSAPGKEVKNAF